MADINFNKIPDKNAKFNQKEFYEDNFEKVRVFGQGVDIALGNAEGRLNLAETDIDNLGIDVEVLVTDVNALELNKVDKVTGKVLSTNDYSTPEKNKVTNLPLNTLTDLGNKVDKVTGKGLTKNEFTDGDKLLLNTTIPAQLGEKAPILTTYTKTEVDDRDNLKANIAQEAWITPTLLNGAVQDSSYPIQYYKDNMGVVRFRGKASNIKSDTPILNMPFGYRPTIASVNISVIAPRSIMSNLTARLIINGGWGIGVIYAMTPNTDLIHFDGFNYRV